VTVAAVILAASAESALADADGLASVRRIADAAWSGGATPIVIVALDPDGRVAASLAGTAVTLAEPAPRELGPAGQMARGIEVGLGEVREATGALLWPARMTWVGPETVTSLIETHGTQPDAVLTPRYEGDRGWPILLPVAALDDLRRVAADRMPDGIVDDLLERWTESPLELGDPGTTHDRDTPRSALPPYVGPVGPPAGHVHEWGAALADTADDAPLDGPSLAPYAPAGEPGG